MMSKGLGRIFWGIVALAAIRDSERLDTLSARYLSLLSERDAK
jgi:hypothetical protein